MIEIKYLSGISTYLFVVTLLLSLLSIMGTSLMITIFIKFPRIRIQSARLVFAINICEIMMTLLILFSFFYRNEYNNKKEYEFPEINYFIMRSEGPFCKFLGFFFLCFANCFLLLNLGLVHNLFFSIKEAQVYNLPKRLRIYAICSILISLIISVISISTGSIGMNPMGYCSLKGNQAMEVIILILFSIIYPFSLYSLYAVIKRYNITGASLDHISLYSDSKFTEENRKNFIKRNISYIIIFLFCWFFPCLLHIWNFISKASDPDSRNQTSSFEAFTVIGLITLSGNSFLLFLVRIKEPIILKYVRKVICCRRKNHSSAEKSQLRQKLINRAQKDIKINTSKLNQQAENSTLPVTQSQEDITIFNKDLGIDCLEHKDLNPRERAGVPSANCHTEEFTSEFKSKLGAYLQKSSTGEYNDLNRSQLGRSFVCSMHSKSKSADLIKVMFLLPKLFKINRDKMLSCKDNFNSKSPPWQDHAYNHFEMMTVNFSDTKFETENPEELEYLSFLQAEAQEKSRNELNIMCFFYASAVFDWLRKHYDVQDEILLKSLDFSKNIERMANVTLEAPNEKEVEILTYDGRFIIKIIGKEVKRLIMERYLKEYHAHIADNRNSFLPKIFGQYSFNLSNKNISFLILENPYYECESKSMNCLARYTMKPTKMKKKINTINLQGSSENRSGSTFFLGENDLKIAFEEKKRLLSILERDLKLLNDIKSYDYSLIIKFYKFDDMELIGSTKNVVLRNSKELGDEEEATKEFNKFPLESQIGFGIISFGNLFTYLYRNQKSTLKSSININFSMVNPEVYGHTLFDAVQEI